MDPRKLGALEKFRLVTFFPPLGREGDGKTWDPAAPPPLVCTVYHLCEPTRLWKFGKEKRKSLKALFIVFHL